MAKRKAKKGKPSKGKPIKGKGRKHTMRRSGGVSAPLDKIVTLIN